MRYAKIPPKPPPPHTTPTDPLMVVIFERCMCLIFAEEGITYLNIHLKYRVFRIRRRQNGLQDSNIFLTDTSQKNKCAHSKTGNHVTRDGMVHISDYGFAHVWEIQQLKPGGEAGSQSMIDSQDTLSTYVTNTDRLMPIPVSVPVPGNKELLPMCEHMKDRVAPMTDNKEFITLCEHGKEKLVPVSSANKDLLPLYDYHTDAMLPVSYTKDMLPMCTSRQGQCQGHTMCSEHMNSCDTS